MADQQEAEPRELLGYREAKDILGVPLGTLYAWVHARRIPHIRLGPRLVKFRRSELEQWLAVETCNLSSTAFSITPNSRS